MRRLIKNVVMLLIIISVCVLSFFTMSMAVKSNVSNNFNKEFNGNMPNFNNGDFPMENMPERPSGDFNMENMPSQENLPEEFKNGERPEGFEGNFNRNDFPRGEFKTNIGIIYYILFVVVGLVVSGLIIYLVMSKFNKKSLKETLGTPKNIIVFLLLTIVITAALTVVQSLTAKNVFAKNNMKQFENINMPINNTDNNENVTEE